MNKLPDFETHMAEVHDLATKARAELHANPVETPTNKVAAPIFLGQERDIIPEKYVIHFSTVTCASCGHTSNESAFYGLVYIRSRMGGSRVRQLVPCKRASFNVPVEKILTGRHTIPYCQACEVIDLSHLPPPPEPTLVTNFPDMLLKGQKPQPVSAPKTPKEPKNPVTLDDLI